MIAREKGKSSWWKWTASVVLCLAALMLVMGAARLPEPQRSAGEPVPTAAAALSAVDERERRYQADIAALERLTEQEMLDETSRADAVKQLRVLVERHQCETQLAAALRAAGYAEPLVVLENGSLTVALTESELADGGRVLSLCLSHAPVEARNVRIITGRAE